MACKSVDIIIPTYKPDDKFGRLIRALIKQTYPVQNIYIINTKGGKFPWELAALDGRIKVSQITSREFNHGGTRRKAVEASGSEFFICMTQDAVPVDEHLVEKLMSAFDDGDVACAYARQLPEPDCNTIERYTRKFNYPDASFKKDMHSVETMGIKAYFCSDVCAAYRRKVYNRAGGFEERVIFNEDMIMAARMIKAGYKCTYVAEAKVIHSHNYGCTEQFKRNFDMGVSQAQCPEIFKEVPPEGEGLRLVRKTAAYLIHSRKPWLLFSLFFQSASKFAGYKLGVNYRKLPQGIVRFCTATPKYWEV